VFDHIGAHGAPGLVAWHTPNGGKRNAVEAARFKAMAVRPGVSDLVAVHDGRIFALELEAPGGRPTEAQLEFIADMERAGDLDRALAVLESSIAAGAKAMTCACFAHRSRPRLEPPAISSGPDDDLGDFQ
jgi:hypothetical protein